MRLPDRLVRTLHDVHEDAEPWLAAFVGHLRACEARWCIRATGLVPDLSYNVVAYAEGVDGNRFILKMSPAGAELSREIAALRLYHGDGIAKLIEADETVGALLIERLEPGVSLWRMEDDEEAARTAAGLMRQLWRPVAEPHPFLPLGRWAEGLKNLRARYHGGTGPLPGDLVARAEGIFAELLGSTAPVLLHGDLHHGNILSAKRQPYLAIDPKGVVGDAGYEVGAFLCNFVPEIASRRRIRGLLEHRVRVFSEVLGMDAQEVAAWGLAQAVLSAWWSLEDHGEGYEPALRCAALLKELC
jgi:streptomycin 6-kinase